MRRPGRPSFDPKERKGRQITVRLKESTVHALEKAAKRRGVSLASEITLRLDDSLEHEAEQPTLFGSQQNFSFALLVGLTLKQVRTLTGTWWYDNAFTFDHAKAAIDVILAYCRPPGSARIPRNLPAAVPGQVRRASAGLPYRQTRFGKEAALEIIGAMEAFSGEYGKKYKELSHLLPEPQREAGLFTAEVYRRMGRGLIPLQGRKADTGKSA